MNIAILGGAFNPPHLGHLLVANQILQFTNNDEVWLTPCYKHTFNKDLIATKHRFAMTNLIKKGKIKCSPIEIKNKLSGHTFYTMKLLKKKYPKNSFSFCMGSDNLSTFKKWGHWKKLIQTNDFLIFPRPGFNYDLKKFSLNNSTFRFNLIKHPLLILSNISSTLIRQRIDNNLDSSYLVSNKVTHYIKTHNLYTQHCLVAKN